MFFGDRGNDLQRRLWVVGIVLGLGGLGCVAQQQLPVQVFPQQSEIYVDGAPASLDRSGALSLRPDRSHVVLIREPGYRTQQVLLESVASDHGYRLRPGRIEVRLQPEIHAGQEIEVGLEENASNLNPTPEVEGSGSSEGFASDLGERE